MKRMISYTADIGALPKTGDKIPLKNPLAYYNINIIA
jgi:hypothetical protein